MGEKLPAMWRFRRRDPDLARDTVRAVAELRVELLRAATLYGVSSVLGGGAVDEVWQWREWVEHVEGLADRTWVRANGLGGMTAEEEGVLDWPALLLERILAHQAADQPVPAGEATTSPREWVDARERLAYRTRRVEEFNGRPLGEISGEGFGAGVTLLGAVEDSLVLVASAKPEEQARRVSAAELFSLAQAARDGGVWDLRPPSRFKRFAHRRAFAGLEPTDQATIERTKAVTERLVLTTIDTVGLYQELAPDGRRLVGDERKAVRERLGVNALCLRDAAGARALLDYAAVKEGIDFRPTIQVLRMAQRSLVLALSEDPGRRAGAMSVETAIAFFRPVYDFTASLWDLPGWDELRSNARSTPNP